MTVHHATFKYKVRDCQSCDAGDEKEGGIDCTCYKSTIPELRDTVSKRDVRFAITYATLSAPPAACTRNLIVVFAGQNGSSVGSVSGNGPSNLTGQQAGWHDKCDDRNCGTQTFEAQALVARLLALMGRENSRAVVFLDHQYDMRSGHGENLGIANGITKYLTNLVSASVVKNIVIAGHSRGGCLALTVARKLRTYAALRDVRLIVLPLDAVCDDWIPNQENWVSSTAHDDNPLSNEGSFYGWHSSYPAYADLGSNTCIANVVGGESFWAFHAMSFGPNPNISQYVDWWTIHKHVDLGTQYDASHIQDGVGSFYFFVKNNMEPAPPVACPKCGAGNCSGCCNASGACIPAPSARECGKGGASCKACTAPSHATASCLFNGECAWNCTPPYHRCEGRCLAKNEVCP